MRQKPGHHGQSRKRCRINSNQPPCRQHSSWRKGATPPWEKMNTMNWCHKRRLSEIRSLWKGPPIFPTRQTHCARGCCIRCRRQSGKNEANEIFVRNDAPKQIELIRVVQRRQKSFIFSCITISIGWIPLHESHVFPFLPWASFCSKN